MELWVRNQYGTEMKCGELNVTNMIRSILNEDPEMKITVEYPDGDTLTFFMKEDAMFAPPTIPVREPMVHHAGPHQILAPVMPYMTKK